MISFKVYNVTSAVVLGVIFFILAWIPGIEPECGSSADCSGYPCVNYACQCPPSGGPDYQCLGDEHFGPMRLDGLFSALSFVMAVIFLCLPKL